MCSGTLPSAFWFDDFYPLPNLLSWGYSQLTCLAAVGARLDQDTQLRAFSQSGVSSQERNFS